MKFREYEANRQWIIEALGKLSDFSAHDNDFRGNRAYEQKAIAYHKQFVEDGKYRVVFLGTFNVGKSTAINAFLGGAYLPMDVEECTSKLTFIQRGERLELVLSLSEPVVGNETKALERVYKEIPASLEVQNDGRSLLIRFEDDKPSSMQQCLSPLVTVMADEDYPLLAPLREKIDEINLFLPSSVLAEDIVFVDTPGVHSVSETRQEITYGIIERSHLVISFVDSGFAGNIHDLNFIKRIIKWRGRRVFFVLNKADKLERDEIDIRGARGPAKHLIQAFARHDIPEDSEIFFLSGYRALRAQQLELGHISMEEVEDDNKVSIPTSVAERIGESDDPTRDLAAYLMGQSRLPLLRERLSDYLLNENKAGAVVETGAKFVWERSDEFVASLENELNLAKDPTKFDELRANREQLIRKLDEIRASSDQVLNAYSARSRGGDVDGVTYPGYAGLFKIEMTTARIEAEVIGPVLQWLRDSNHLKEARRSKFAPLSAQMEHQVDEFVSSILAKLNETIEKAENDTREAIARHLGEVRGLRMHLTEPGQVDIANVNTSMTGSYVVFGAGGALVGLTTGLVVGSVVPVIGNAIGALLGGVLGAVGGFLTRLAWSEERWLKKLEPIIREHVLNMLIHGAKDKDGSRTTPVQESVVEYLQRRADSFYTAVQEEVDNAISKVQQECDGLLAREGEIRRESDTIIARLEPKVTLLVALREGARDLVNEIDHRESVRV
ncbi:MAG: dynamin family protein [Candidatus Hydrogenedentes bacterium]|nr:dynamin family protein [Candidatus Hydrogenedentota bacterium]